MGRAPAYRPARVIRVRSTTGVEALGVESGRFAVRLYDPHTRRLVGVVNAAREGNLPDGPIRPGSTAGLVWSAINRSGIRCPHQLTRAAAVTWLLDPARSPQ